MSTRARSSRRNMGPRTRRGLATVEFVICAPVLLLLMLATAEVGRLLFQYNTLTKSVRDGVRFAITDAAVAGGSTRIVNITAQVISQTRNLVVTGNTAGTGTPLLPGLLPENVSVTNVGNGFVSVAATYTYRPMVGARLPTFGFGPPINVSLPVQATVVMRAL
jgi:Flp pilus assembly protein TadG